MIVSISVETVTPERVTDALTETRFAILLAVGLPALFVLKGSIVGKPFPTSVFLPDYIVAVSATGRTIAISIAVVSVGYVCGQLAIYAIARQYGVDAVRSLWWVEISDERLRRAVNSAIPSAF